MSIDVFDYNAGVGPSWDSPWTPPIAVELEASGGFTPAPDRLATWAERYHCTDAVDQVTVDDPGEELDRDTVFWSHTDCDAPLYWFGVQNRPEPEIGAVDVAIILAFNQLQGALRRHVGP